MCTSSRFAFCIIVAVTSAAAALAQERAQSASAARSTSNTLRLLNQVIPEVSVDAQPLESVLEWLAEFTQVNFNVRWSVLTDAGVKRDAPVSLQARNLRLSQVLWLIMSEVGAGEIRLGYRASSSLILISTADDLDRELVTKVYDVSDLLLELPRASRQPRIDVTRIGGQGSSGIAVDSFGQSGTDYSSDEKASGARETVDRLVDLIQQTIEPDTWRLLGGTGSIYSFGNLLVVRNTLHVHQLLGGYLEEQEVGGH